MNTLDFGKLPHVFNPGLLPLLPDPASVLPMV